MIRGLIHFLLWVGAFAGVAVGVGKYFFFDIAVVGHNGMAPTLLSGEKILIYRRAEPGLGKVMICQHPDGDGFVVGRIAAVGGQLIETDKDVLKVNNKVYKRVIRGVTEFYDKDTDESNSVIWGEEYTGDQDPHWFFINKSQPFEIDPTEVPAGQAFLLGDNRASFGQDSRAFETVDISTCQGQVMLRLTPQPGLYSTLQHGHFDLIE